jgi:deazaflavin-dependent oxidoreductase (nitroreductase family)
MTGQQASTIKPGAGWFRASPSGLLRLALKLPTLLYRAHLGWLLGHRFLLLTHRGRKSGRVHQTVLEVVRHDPTTRESTVAAGWGTKTDWYRNVQAHPALAIQTGRQRYRPEQRFLTPEEAVVVLRGYVRRYPWAPWLGSRLFGLHLGHGGQRTAEAAKAVPMVAFRPRQAPRGPLDQQAPYGAPTTSA